MSTAATVAPKSRWMISPWWDALFFIGTPLLCAAFLLPLKGVVPSVQVYAVVLAFVSFGHHLPGFLRAYGDPELFARYRLRFLIVPPAAFMAFLYFSYHDLHGLLLLLVVWDLWHLMMQHYGFMRIYDAKVGSTSRRTARLDFWMCLGWFVSLALWSPQYRSTVLSKLYESGFPFVAPGLFKVVLYSVTALTLAVTVANLMNILRAARAGRPVSSVKLLLHALTTAYLYLVWIAIGDLFLGVAAFNVYHAVQYYAIVWIYNRGLVQRGHRTSRFLRFLFRPRPALVLLYVLLIFGYGAVNYAGSFVTAEHLVAVLAAFGGTSTLLHYYFDGFIWKVRQPKTREALAIATSAVPASAETAREQRAAPWSTFVGRHKPLAHAACLALPIVTLAVVEMTQAPSADARRPARIAESIAALAPQLPNSHRRVAEAYRALGRWDRAAPALEHAVALAPRSADLYADLAVAYQNLGRSDDAMEAFGRALELEPDHAGALFGIGALLSRRDDASAQTEAADYLRRAIASEPADPAAYLVLGRLRSRQGRTEDATRLFDRAGEALARSTSQPANATLYLSLSRAYASVREPQKARAAQRRADEFAALAPPKQPRGAAQLLIER